MEDENKIFISFNRTFLIVGKHLLLVVILLLTALPSIASMDKWFLKSIKVNYLDDPNFNRPSGMEIEFTNGHVAKSELVELKTLDYLVSKEGVPFILFSGRECTECDMNIGIYINAAEEKNYGLNRFEYPGTLKSFEDGRLLSEARMFYGECVVKGSKVVVYYARFIDEKNKWQQKVDSFNFHQNQLVKSRQQLPYNTINQTESLQEAGLCFEVYGLERHSEP